jgi:beta-ribofuranosylaminobenzene 5'-phosphate synthase
MKVRIVAPCRVHLGLIALSRRSTRAYGGAGFALWHESTIVEAQTTTARSTLVDGVDDDLCSQICSILSSAGLDRVRLSIRNVVSPHVGLGSKTSLVLACVEGALIASGLPAPRRDVVRIAGRGGASGVGVNTYFVGGVLADLGHPAKSVASLAPSSRRTVFDAPRALFRMDFPKSWRVILLRAKNREGLHSSAEEDFFRRNCDLDRGECADAAMALGFELPAAVAECDIEALAQVLRSSRSSGFKAREIETQPTVRDMLDQLDLLPGVAATMSSMGPTITVISNQQSSLELIAASLDSDEGWEVVLGEAANAGRCVAGLD